MKYIFSGLCDGVPETCSVLDETVADRSDCLYYYICSPGLQWVREECTNNSPGSKCTSGGVPCVYDINTNFCIHPDSSFNCDYRCTTVAPSVEVTSDSVKTTEQRSFSSVQDVITTEPMMSSSTEGAITTETLMVSSTEGAITTADTTTPAPGSPLGYYITQMGEFSSSTGQPFTPQCTQVDQLDHFLASMIS